MKIKENIITTMDQLEAMQEDGDNCYQEEMLQSDIALTDLDSDLQSRGNSTSGASPPTVTVIVIDDWYQDLLHKKNTGSDLLPRGLMHVSLKNNASTSRCT